MIPVPGALFTDATITGPASEPLTGESAGDYVRQLAGVDTDRLSALAKASRQWIEQHTPQRFFTQTRELALDGFPSCRDWVPFPSAPVTSVVSVTVVTPAGDSVVVDPTTYWLDAADEAMARLVFTRVPSGMRDQRGLLIRYVCGYGTSPADVPAPLMLALEMLVAHWYANPTGMASGTLGREAEFSLSTLLAPYQWGDLG